MLAIFKRDFKSFFQNVIGWVFIAAMILVGSLYFRVYNLSAGYPDLRYMLINLMLVLVFAIPVLTMRSFPEERKNKIDQLTLTSPVSIGKLVLGKYLAMVAVVAVTMLALGSFLLLIAIYMSVDWAINGLALLGFFLYCCASIALCMFVSSFTESQVLAAVISILATFIVYMLAGIQYLFSVTENPVLVILSKGMGVMNFTDRFDAFLNGVLDLKSIIYFVTVIAVFLFLTTQVIQKRRFTATVKNISIQAFSISSIAIVIAAAILLNIGIKAIPTKYTELDITSQRLYTLTDATKELVKTVNEPVNVYVYVAEDDKDVTVDRILNKYAQLNKNIHIEYKDPAKAPKLYEKYTESVPSANSIFMEMGEKTRYIDTADLYVNDYSYNEQTGSYDTVTKYDIEGQLTAGLSYLMNGTAAKIYKITGHDEYELEAGYLDAIKKANYDTEDISLLGKDIPQDCQIIFINAPTSDYSSEDADKIIQFLDNGGTAIITLEVVDNLDKEMPNFNRILEYFGVSVSNGLVVDLVNYAQSPFFILPNVVSGNVTTGVAGRKNVWMPYAKALIYDEESKDVMYDAFFISSKNSFNKNDLVNADNFNKGENDEDGPFNVGVTATKNGKGKAYIVGSPFVFSDTVDGATANASATIFMNMIKNSVTEDTSYSAVVPARTMDSEPLVINSMAGIIIFLLLLFVVPLALVVTGVVIWIVRRKK